MRQNACDETYEKETIKHKKNVFKRLAGCPRKKKIQIIAASILTIAMIVSISTYSWFNMQKEMQRFERINSPDTLFITAAHKEDTIYLKMDGIDVTSYWDVGETDPVSYKYYVFSVAGNYVTDYNLQLAHTTNNNYRYEIFEAEFTTTDPKIADSSLIDGKDFVSYTVTDDWPDSEEFPTIANRKDKNGNTVPISAGVVGDDSDNTVLYYTIRKDTSGNPVSLNVSNYGSTVGGNTVVSKTYTVNVPGTAENTTVTYNGHYLNAGDGFLANRTYHSETYGTYASGNVEEHAEPRYWLATDIEVDGSASRDPFYHEYILKVSWNNDGDDTARADFKDTDIICITAGVD